MDPFTQTRNSLHGIAEGLMAGPQYRDSGTIRLSAAPEGVSTVAEPSLLLTANGLGRPGGPTHPLVGTFAELAERLGSSFHVPDLYSDHAPIQPTDPVVVDESSASRLLAWLADGTQALRDLAPTSTPVLWPEHFDVGISLGEVNYGVSPGDDFSAEPYAYVGPWGFTPSSDGFFDAPFGAARMISSLSSTAELTAFFREGQDRLA